jgi:hypothetical protein
VVSFHDTLETLSLAGPDHIDVLDALEHADIHCLAQRELPGFLVILQPDFPMKPLGCSARLVIVRDELLRASPRLDVLLGYMHRAIYV